MGLGAALAGGLLASTVGSAARLATASGSNQNYGGKQGSSSAGWTRSSTNPVAANIVANSNAAEAYNRQVALNQQQMAFNAAEAQKQRDWEERMANTIYTRSVANMKEAGINPILAASMGLSGAAVGSGATASMGGSSAPLAQSFMGSESSGENVGSSWGENWGNSTSASGLPEFLNQASDTIQNIQNTVNSAGLFGIKAGSTAKELVNQVIGKVNSGLYKWGKEQQNKGVGINHNGMNR